MCQNRTKLHSYPIITIMSTRIEKKKKIVNCERFICFSTTLEKRETETCVFCIEENHRAGERRYAACVLYEFIKM